VHSSWTDYSKKSKDDPTHEGKHDLQWSGDLFRCQHNIWNADIAAWLGGVHLGQDADVQMESKLSVWLPEAWPFLPGKVGLPFLSAVAHPSSNDGSVLFFACMVKTCQCNRDPVMSGLVALHPIFIHIFANSLAFLSSFCKHIFSNGLASVMPNHISCWYFLSSLDTHPDSYLHHNGLTSPQLAQVLINYKVYFKQIFANGCNYTQIPPTHALPATWQGTYHGRLVIGFCHFLLPKTIMVWNKHRQGASNQGRCLIVGFMQWPILSAFHCFWPQLSRAPAATRHVLPMSKSAMVDVKETVE